MSSKFRERLRSLESSQKGSGAGPANRSMVIAVIALLAIALVVVLIFVVPRTGIGAGKAVQQTTPGAYQFVATDANKGIKFENTVYYADPDDTLNLVVYMTSDASINQIDYEVDIVGGLVVTPAGCDIDPNVNCGTIAHSLGMSPYDRSTSDPIWSIAGGLGVSGSNIKMFTIPFKVQSAPVGDTITVTLNDIYLRDVDGVTQYGPITAAATVNVVDFCTDADGDGRGAVGTELKACSTPNVGDCDDTRNNVYPGKAELCDGLDNDCANGPDDGLVGQPNTNTLGVCWGNQFCTGAGGWVDSYTATEADISAAGLTPVAFTDPSGTATTQQQLYSASTELCDFFDNDCDGSVNEEMTSCSLGNVGVIAAKVPGNVFFEYDDTSDVHTTPQVLELVDTMLFNLLWATVGSSCGTTGAIPCGFVFETGTNIAFCKEGTYWFETGGAIDKYSPTEDRVLVTGVSGINNPDNLEAAGIVCP